MTVDLLPEVAFVLDYRPEAQSFLDGLNLDRDGRLRLFRTLQGLRRVFDDERIDPANRLGVTA